MEKRNANWKYVIYIRRRDVWGAAMQMLNDQRICKDLLLSHPQYCQNDLL